MMNQQLAQHEVAMNVIDCFVYLDVFKTYHQMLEFFVTLFKASY